MDGARGDDHWREDYHLGLHVRHKKQHACRRDPQCKIITRGCDTGLESCQLCIVIRTYEVHESDSERASGHGGEEVVGPPTLSAAATALIALSKTESIAPEQKICLISLASNTDTGTYNGPRCQCGYGGVRKKRIERRRSGYARLWTCDAMAM